MPVRNLCKFMLLFLCLSFRAFISADSGLSCDENDPENDMCFSEDFADNPDGQPNIMQDLLIVNYWNERMNEKFPVTYNHLLMGGYFSMPSARMGEEGEIGVGYGYIPPYINYNARFQLTEFLEVTGNYRVFKGVADPVLTEAGFGDFSDKGANVKLSLFRPEDSYYRLPGFAIGLEDFIGTKAFHAYYLVLTQVFLNQNLEVTLGFGAKRIRQWFGGVLWMPFRKEKLHYLKNLAFVVEYDAIPYEDEDIEKHPKGRKKNTAFQIGLKYRLWDFLDFSAAYIRGHKWAFTASAFYNFGSTKGLVPKIDNTLPYKAPVNFQQLGELRPASVMIQEIIFAFRGQGFELIEAWLCDECGRKVLRLSINNFVYRDEFQVRTRLNALLSSLTPDDVEKVIVVTDVLGFPIQELHFETAYLRMYRNQEIGRYELDLLTPYKEVTFPNIYTSRLIFKRSLDKWNLELKPKVNTVFGSASGKFKYGLGLAANINGFLFNDIYYSIGMGYFFASHFEKVNDIDRLNPSQIIHVRSDIIRYLRQPGLSIDEAYVEKTWNWGKGWYSRIAVGLFEIEYGGAAFEWLYYPVNSNWAIGMDYALLKKRAPHGVDFTDKVRKLNGFKAHWERFIGTQYFLNLYYDWRCINLEFKVSAGKFLAHDYGVRTEISRYFPSGLRLGFWYTYTNAHDVINSSVYHDKGVFITVPLDIFYTSTNRTRWGYAMSAWLRDIGVAASTGTRLYNVINQERQ